MKFALVSGVGIENRLHPLLRQLKRIGAEMKSVLKNGRLNELKNNSAYGQIQAQPAQDSPEQKDGNIRRTVLYVEDNPVCLALVAETLARRPDLQLISAADGNLGVEYARTYLPNVILMDLNLPGISGLDAMKILRADQTTAHIPVIALSANAVRADIVRSLDAGFFNYITKPIKLTEFMAALDVALEFSDCNSTEVAATALTKE